MSNYDGRIRGFHWTSRAYYASSIGDRQEILFGMYDENGEGTSGEMAIRWVDVGAKVAPRLEVFDDAWSALFLFNDLLEAMSEVDGQNITQEDFVALLLDHGFIDLTAYNSPYKV